MLDTPSSALELFDYASHTAYRSEAREISSAEYPLLFPTLCHPSLETSIYNASDDPQTKRMSEISPPRGGDHPARGGPPARRSIVAEEPGIGSNQDVANSGVFDDELTASTQSLPSSVMDSPVVNGRQHLTYWKEAYTHPNDNYDLDRLDTVHIMIQSILDGELFLAPIDRENIQSVLDIGTGSGTLAMELGDLLPRTQVIGCDLSPVQPTWVPPNVKFEVGDVESEWAYSFTFDYIISRAMACSIANWPKLVQNIYDNLSPGAWGELQDFDLEICTDDDTVTDDHYIKKYYADLIQGASLLKRSARPGPKLLELAKAAGFINLEEQVFKVPLGPWPQDEHLKRVGVLNMLQVLDGVDEFSFLALPMLGYSKEEIAVLVAHVRREIESRTLHIYFKFFVVYGQKP